MKMSKSIKLNPPKGGKSVKDWVGRRVSNLVSFQNSQLKVPELSKGTVTDTTRGKGLTITFDECPCCKVQAITSGVSSNLLKEINEEAE